MCLPFREEESQESTLDVEDSTDRTDFSLSGLRLVEPSAEDDFISPAGDLSWGREWMGIGLFEVMEAWPVEVREEIDGADESTIVRLDRVKISNGLANGRVEITWGELLAILEPPLTKSTSVDEATVLLLPLKVIAPAFLRGEGERVQARRGVEIDAEIPDLFRASSVYEEVEELKEVEEVEVVPLRLVVEVKAEVEIIQPEKDAMGISPDELVKKIGELSGVRGAMISLGEGLAVSSMLSAGMRAEVLAAFIPQIFVRIQQYTGEMDLGVIDQMVLSTESGRCQLNRRGEIFLSVFGEKNHGFPVEELEKYVGIFREGNLGIGI